MTMRERFEKNAEIITGMTISELRDASPGEFRHYCEIKSGEGFSFVSEYPSIGRGNVLRDGIVTRDALNLDIDRMLEN